MFRSSVAILILAFSTTTYAQDFDYNFLQLNYGKLEFDDVNVDGDGFGIAGSFAVHPNWHVFANLQAAGLDFGIDATTISAGAGYNRPLSPGLDFIANLSYQYVELDAGGFGDADDSGFGLGAGLRYMATSELEFTAGISFVDFGDSGNDTGFSLGGLYSLSDTLAVGLGGSWSDDSSAYTISGRFYFDK